MNFPLALYNRQRPSRFLSAASPFIAVLLTLLIGCLIFAGMGKDPMHSMYVFIVEPLLTLRGWGELGVKMTPVHWAYWFATEQTCGTSVRKAN